MSATAIHGDFVGRVVSGRFTLLRWLSSSRGVETYLTEFGDPSQKATVKLVPAGSGDAEIRMSGWLAAANLSHPHLIKVFASGRCEIGSSPMLYVVTEYADEVLAEIIPERALTPEEAREMLGPAVDALAYLHAKGLVHGRLKPSNIMAVGDRLKLSADGLILAGAIGKPSIERTIYDAPETIQGRIGAAADVWALGATLVEILTQRPPAWYGATAAEPAVPESVPEPFATIARECLRKDPARRCTLDQIRMRLDPSAVLAPVKKKAVLEFKNRPEEPARPVSPPLASVKPAIAAALKPAVDAALAVPRRRVVVSAAVVALLILVFVVWAIRSNHQPPSQPAPQTQSASPATAPAPQAASPQSFAETSKRDQSAASAAVPSPVPASPNSAATSPRSSAASQAPLPSSANAVPAESAPAVPLSQPQPATSQPSAGGASKGAVVQQVEPDVLAGALRTISGTVKVAVRVSVDATGRVTDAGFESAGPSKYFGGKAVDAARHWTFKPAQVDGQPVASVWILHFDFKQSGVTAAPVETAP
jgi:eukaryotic-like serine/threonine-protein kinase